MSGIELTLVTLRRTHFGLIVVALGLLSLSMIRGRDYDLALEEIRATQELLARGAMDDICVEAAQVRFAPLWGQLAGQAFLDRGHALFEGFTTSITAYCPHPTPNQPLGQIATFLREGLLVDVPQPLDSALVPILARNARAVRLGEAFFLWDTEVAGRWNGHVALIPLTDQELVAITSREDSLDVRLLYSGVVDPDRRPPDSLLAADLTLAAGADTISGRLPVSGDVVRLRVPGSIHQSRWHVEDIVQSDPRWEVLVAPRDDEGELPVLPDLQPFWTDISGLPAGEAEVFLESLTREEQGRIEALGVVVSTRTLGWVGPVVPFILILYLLLNLQHLGRIVRDDPTAVGRFPWFGVFQDGLSGVVTALTVVALPAVPAGILSLRLWATNLTVALWAGALGLASAAMGIWILRVLARVRESIRA